MPDRGVHIIFDALSFRTARDLNPLLLAHDTRDPTDGPRKFDLKKLH